MTNITFYARAQDRISVAIQVCKRALKKKMKISVITSGDDVSRKIADLLWLDSPTSFLPNCDGSSSLQSKTPIIVDHRSDLLRESGVLINLTDEIPKSFSSFDRLIEIVNQEDRVQKEARIRFKFYRDRGYPLNTHQLDKF